MTREETIEGLIALKLERMDMDEPASQLWGHFAYEYDHDEIRWLEEDGKIVAYLDFSWVSNEEDVQACYDGKPTQGEVLNIINVVCTKSDHIWKLKKLLPAHKYISGMRGGDFHAHRRNHA